MNAGELDKLIEYVHHSSLDVTAKKINKAKVSNNDETFAEKPSDIPNTREP